MLTSKGIITPLQEDVIRSFAGLPDSDSFYLAVGTALSDFYLAHRKSFDLDIFTTEENLVLPFSRLFERRLEKSFPLEVIRRHATFAEFQVGMEGGETRVQLAYDSPRRFEEPEDSNLGIKVNDYRDLAVDKLLAFCGRAEPRDAVDLFSSSKRRLFGTSPTLPGRRTRGSIFTGWRWPWENRGLPC